MDGGTMGAGIVAAVASSLIFYPVDTARTIRQADADKYGKIPLRYYWRGVTVTMTFTAPLFATYLVAYRKGKELLSPYLGENTTANYMGSGLVAQLAISPLSTAVEVLTVRMQILGKSKTHQSALRLGHELWTKGELFRGYWLGLAVYAPHSMVWWWTYEKMKIGVDHLSQKTGKDLSNYKYGIAAGLSEVTASLVSNFLDVVKTRQRVATSDEMHSLRPTDSQSAYQISKNLIKTDGFKAPFRGLTVRLAQTIPAGMLSMTIVEKLKPDKSSEKHKFS